MVFILVYGFGSAGRHLLGDGEELKTPGQWIKTIVIGLILFIVLGSIVHKSGCYNEGATEYEMDRSRDRGY